MAEGGCHTEELYNQCLCPGLCVCEWHARRPEKRDRVRVREREHTFINAETVQACGHGDKRKNKIKATNTNHLPRWASFSWGRSTRQLTRSLTSLARLRHVQEMQDTDNSGPSEQQRPRSSPLGMPRLLWLSQGNMRQQHSASYVILKQRIKKKRDPSPRLSLRSLSPQNKHWCPVFG